MKQIKLPPRLLTAAGFIPEHGSFADIGADHGLVPAYLALNGHDGPLIASDVAEGPLMSARLTAREADVEERIRFILSDGLAQLPPQDTLLIAGMGGETIAGILERSPWPLDRTRLILQPQSRLPELRIWLWEHSFEVEQARLVKDAGRLYIVLSAFHGEFGERPSPAELYADRRLLDGPDPLLRDWVSWHLGRLRTALKGLESAERGLNRQDADMRAAADGLQALLNELR